MFGKAGEIGIIPFGTLLKKVKKKDLFRLVHC
jgi:hypothetical protein